MRFSVFYFCSTFKEKFYKQLFLASFAQWISHTSIHHISDILRRYRHTQIPRWIQRATRTIKFDDKLCNCYNVKVNEGILTTLSNGRSSAEVYI